VIERVIEGWLTSVNERQYQIPFCQLLMAEGEAVVSISTHGQMEQGKDVITKLKNGKIRAYQLKCGRITLTDWRKIRSEIVELVEYPVQHPSINARKSHESVLVTNGTVADTVTNAIRSENKAWKKRGLGHLELTVGSELVARFIRAHGRYLPQSPTDFGKFLDLVVRGGEGPLDKEVFSAFLESVLPLKAKRIAFREVQRSITSAVLLTTYIIQRNEQSKNHWAIFEAWIMLGSYILATQEKHGVPTPWWEASFNLVQLAALAALENLCDECISDERMFTQGNPLVDGHAYHSRITILSGLLSSLSLYHRIKKDNWKHHIFVHDFLSWYGSYFRLSGESIVPHLFLAALELEQHGEDNSARSLIRTLIEAICQENGAKADDKEGKGLANPYYDPEATLRLRYNLGLPSTESFLGHSYSLEALILFAARRNERNMLADLWARITRVSFAVFSVEEPWDFFRWRAESGILHTKMPETPQSWSSLRNIASSPVENMPGILLSKPEFLFFFCMVYPHRFSYNLIKIMDLREMKP
jgi:hypothetical protein